MSNNFQKEMADLQREIDRIEKRRVDLLGELAQATQGVVDKRKAAGSQLLAGKDTSNGLQILASETVRVDAIQEAISLADDQIRLLKQQLADKERAAVQVVFDRVKVETNDLVSEGVARLYDLQAAIDAIDKKFAELRAAGGSYIQPIENVDGVRRMRNVLGMLKNVMAGGTSQSGTVVLRTFEKDYQEFVTQVQAKK